MEISFEVLKAYGPWVIGWIAAVWLFIDLRAANRKVAELAATSAAQIAALFTLLSERLPPRK